MKESPRSLSELIHFYLDTFSPEDFEIANHILTWKDEEKLAFKIAYMNYKDSND